HSGHHCHPLAPAGTRSRWQRKPMGGRAGAEDGGAAKKQTPKAPAPAPNRTRRYSNATHHHKLEAQIAHNTNTEMPLTLIVGHRDRRDLLNASPPTHSPDTPGTSSGSGSSSPGTPAPARSPRSSP